MRLLRRTSFWVVIVVTLILIMTCMYFHMKNKYMELKTYNEVLCNTINKQTSSINELENENIELKSYISQLEEKNAQLQQEDKIPQTQETNHSDFKSYMAYTAITNKASKQYKLQQSAYTGENGFRYIDGRPMVAVGTGWGLSIGDIALITCENNNSFEVVIGDYKANKDTTSDNKTTLSNNCRCEFIIDIKELNSTVKRSGNVAVLNQYKGYVINVQKIG